MADFVFYLHLQIRKMAQVTRQGLITGHGAQGSAMLIEFQQKDDPGSEFPLRVKQQRLRDKIQCRIADFPVAVSVTTANDLVVDITFLKTE